MSQTVSEMPDAVDRRVPADPNEFECLPIPPLAPITLFLGVCAVAGLAGIPMLAIGFAGTLTGLLSLWQIRRAEGELGGKVVAKIGVTLSFLFLVSGSALHTYTYITELPEGHVRVKFRDLANQPIGADDQGQLQISPEVSKLEGQRIFIKGYMYPTRTSVGLREFVLVKDNKDCCFGGNPKPTDMIVVKLKDGMTVNHKDQVLVSVAGTFHAQGIVQSGELAGVYSLDGTHFQ